MGKRVRPMTTERGSLFEKVGLRKRTSEVISVDECMGGNPFVAIVYDRFGRVV